MVDGINWWRAYAGLNQLHFSSRLRRSAKSRSRTLMRHDFFAHPPRLRVASFDRVGEVLELHGGGRARVRRTIQRWSRSPAHRAVLTSPGFRRIGAARTRGWYRGQRATIWVVRLGTR